MSLIRSIYAPPKQLAWMEGGSRGGSSGLMGERERVRKRECERERERENEGGGECVKECECVCVCEREIARENK